MRRLFIILIVFIFNVSFCQLILGNDTYRNLQIKHCVYYNAYFDALYTQIFKDKFNLYWCTSDAGLVRYDGNQFVLFEYPEFKHTEISKVCSDNERFIWILLSNSNWIQFDTQNESYRILGKFYTIDHAKDLYSYADKIFVVNGDGVVLLNKGRFQKQKAFSFSGDYINMYGFDEHVVLLTTHYIYIYNCALNKLTVLDSKEFNLTPQQITCLSFDSNNLLICDSDMNIHHYNMSTNSCSIINISSDVSSPINGIVKIKESEYLLHARDGIYLFNRLHHTTANTSYSLVNVYDLNPYLSTLITNGISDIKYDERNKTLWLSQKESSLIKMTFKNEALKMKSMLSCGKPINSIVEDKMGYVWIATNGAGVFKSTTNAINDDTQFELFESNDRDNNYFIGTKDQTNLIIAHTNGSIESIDLLKNERTTLFENLPVTKDLKSIFISSKNELWIANSKEVALYNLQTKRQVASTIFSVELSGNISLIEDLSGHIWMGNSNGLFRVAVSGKTLSLHNYKSDKKDEELGEILAIYVDHDNQLIVSSSKGLFTIDTANSQTECLVNNNKSIDPISTIIKDNQGNLWFGGRSSIFSNSNIDSNLYRYPISGDAPGVCKLNNGTLLWINNLGVISFNPTEVIDKNTPRSAMLIDIKANHKEQKGGIDSFSQFAIQNLPRYTEFIDLKYNENSLKLYTSEGVYNDPYNPLYYRIIPDDTTWKPISSNSISLNKLKPGSHNVQIKSISPNRFDNNITSINLHVARNCLWWKILLLVMLLIISILIAIVMIINNYRKLINSIFETRKAQFSDSYILDMPSVMDTIRHHSKHTLKIVLVEYYGSSFRYLNDILSENNTIYVAHNGEDALEIAAHQQPDLLIIDSKELFLLDFNFYRLIKQQSKSSETTIISYEFLTKEMNCSILEATAREHILNRLDYVLENRSSSDLFNKELQTMVTVADEILEPNIDKQCEFIDQVEEMITQNIETPNFSVKQLAELFNMSQSSFYRKIKELTNESIITLIRRVKMKKALELLQTRKYHVREVAEQVGYNDTSTFRKHFVNFYNITPSRFFEIEQ